MEHDPEHSQSQWGQEGQQPAAPGYSYPPAGNQDPGYGGYPPPYPDAQPPQWGMQAPHSGYGAGYPGGPYPQPGYPGQAGPPSQGFTPLGHVGPPSQGFAPPGYPVQPGYGWPAAPSTPYGYPPGALPPAPRKGPSAAAIVGIVAAVLVVVIATSIGVLLALRPARRGTSNTVASGQSTATAGAQATTTQAGAGGYRYDFKDSLNGASNVGWSDDQYCFFKNGAYHANPGSEYGSIYCEAPAGSFSDFDMHVTLSEKAGPLDYSYGLAFRHPAAHNYYVFTVASNGDTSFDKIVDGKWAHLPDEWQATNFSRGLNTSNTIRIVGKGSTFTFYVNGVKVGQATDTTFATGTVGVFSGDSNLDAAFTNFEVQGNP